MKHLVRLTVLLAVTAWPGLACAEETRACEFKAKAGCVSGEARVTLADGAVRAVAVDVFYCGPRGRPGYSCTIDSSRSEKDAKWSDEGGATLIDNESPFNSTRPDRVKVTVGKYVSIDLEEAQSLGRCGAGAELPQAIVIPEKKGACRVFFGKP
jgi:hypothetical protein